MTGHPSDPDPGAGPSTAPRVYVVISHYNPTFSDRVRFQSLHAMGCWLDSRGLSSAPKVIVSDGSDSGDDPLSRVINWADADYCPSYKNLSFAAGYNQGIERAVQLGAQDSDVIILCASDILVNPGTAKALLEVLEREGDRAGCVIPYLSQADLAVQRSSVYPDYRRIGLMTLNVNAFRLGTLKSLGGVPEAYTGYYNDLDMAIGLKAMGKSIVLMDAGPITHLQRGTVSASSGARFTLDKAEFARRHPGYMAANDRMPFAYSRFGARGPLRTLYRIIESSAARPFTRQLRGLETAYYAAERVFYERIYYPLNINRRAGGARPKRHEGRV